MKNFITVCFLISFVSFAGEDFKGNEETGKTLKKEFHTFRKKMQGFEKEITGKATSEEKDHSQSLKSQGEDLQKSTKKALNKLGDGLKKATE